MTTPQTIRLADYQPCNYGIEHTDLRVQIFDDYSTVTSNIRFQRNPEGPGGDLVLDGDGLKTLSIALDGRPLTKAEYELSDQTLTLYNSPDQFLLTLVVELDPDNNKALEGFYRSKGLYCTQCEAQGFRRITWYLDRPDVMATFSCRLEADADSCPVLLANGNRVASGPLMNGRHFVAWTDPHPKPSYLFAMVAGQLSSVTDQWTTAEGRLVQLAIYVQPHNLDKTDFAMAALKRSMHWDEQRFGRCYDLDCFMIVAVDHFNMGAMENKGLNIFNSACVLASPETSTDAQFENIEAIIGHEYFHNWSGNRVTCREWFQLSLKEGFTVYRDSEFTSDLHSRSIKRIDDVNLLRTRQFAEDAGPMAHPVRPQSYVEINNFYTLTVYEKGAELVRMLATILGAEAFRAGSDLYFSRYDGQAVTTEDFVACMQAQTQVDLAGFQHWYDFAGTPELEVQGQYDAKRSCWILTARQRLATGQNPSLPPAFTIPVALGFVGADGQDVAVESTDSAWLASEGVWLVTQAEQRIEFTGANAQALPSLLRGFSAPVKLSYPYSQAQLAFLAAKDADEFNRWDAMQRLASQLILANLDGPEPKALALLAEAMASCLADERLDAAIKASLISLPSLGWLAEQLPSYDPVRLKAAHLAWQQALAKQLLEPLQAKLAQLELQPEYVFDFAAVSQRRLWVALTQYLVWVDDLWLEALPELFVQAQHQTQRAHALKQLVEHASEAKRQQALAQFYQTWQHDQQMLEFWFSVQAQSRHTHLAELQALLAHSAYDATNPNLVRSVLGQFANNNSNFHRDYAVNYPFLMQQVRTLDRQNPQLAARLVTPLTQWQRLVAPYSECMQQQLLSLSESQLSSDLFEVVSKSLAKAQS